MSEKRFFHLMHDQARKAAAAFCLTAPVGWIAQFSEENRTLSQNAAQWPILQAFSEQLQWPVNGAMCYLTPEDWKDILTAAFKRETVRVAMGLEGGMVLLGFKTSKFGKKEFSEWLEYLHATAALRGVVVYADERIAA